MNPVFLAFDDGSLPFRKNVCLYLGKPKVRFEPVLAPSPHESSAPDNLAAQFYGTVLHDAEKIPIGRRAKCGRRPKNRVG